MSSEKRKQQYREYRLRHLDEVKMRDHNRKEKERLLLPWKIHYRGAKARCGSHPKLKDRKHYKDKGIECKITLNEVKELYFRDKADLMKKPSIDRKDNNGHYTFDNCQFIELADNARKAKSKAIIQLDKQYNFIASFPSAIEAGRVINTTFSHICEVANGQLKTSGGFIWMWKENYEKYIT